jgi:hypothetical protein
MNFLEVGVKVEKINRRVNHGEILLINYFAKCKNSKFDDLKCHLTGVGATFFSDVNETLKLTGLF